LLDAAGVVDHAGIGGEIVERLAVQVGGSPSIWSARTCPSTLACTVGARCGLRQRGARLRERVGMRGGARSGRDGEAETARLRDADLLADQPVGPQPDVERGAAESRARPQRSPAAAPRRRSRS
jgi:hypothetical protein